MKHLFSKEAQRLTGSPMFQMLARVQELERAGKEIVHFEIGDPDFNTPDHVIDATVKALKGGDTHYVNSLGISELRDAVCEDVYRTLGWRPSRGQVVVAPAISFIYFAVRALLNPGDEVIVSDPGYSSYFSAFDFIGVTSKTVPVYEENNFRMKAADLEKVITPKSRLLIINSPKNPTGAVIGKSDLKEIYDLCRKRNIYILSDEVYSKIVYDGPFTSISENDQCRERVIVMNGFSKAYAMTGWRLGYAIAPAEIVEKFGLMIETIISHVPPFIQRGGVRALLGDQASVKEMMAEYSGRRELLVKGLNTIPGISCRMPDGAFYVFANIKNTRLSSLEFSRKILDEAGVALLPGSDFGKNGEGYVRFTFATSKDNIRKGLEKMTKAMVNWKIKN